MGPVYLSVVIPVYNEQDRIVPTLREIAAYLSGREFSWEIIIVDDGSTDRTVGVVEDLVRAGRGLKLLKNPSNRGKGYAVRQGILASSGDNVLFTDADLSAPIQEAEKLISCLKQGCDIAIGSRTMKGSVVKGTPARRFIGTIFNFIVRTMVMPDMSDTQCGFKCFKGDAARSLFGELKTSGFSFDVEILYLAKLRGYSIRQVPVNWIQSSTSRVRILRDSVRMFFDVLDIRRRLGPRRGK